MPKHLKKTISLIIVSVIADRMSRCYLYSHRSIKYISIAVNQSQTSSCF